MLAAPDRRCHDPMRSAVVLLAVALCSVSAGRDALAWGRSGHRIVGELAQARLDPKAAAAVAELLAGEPEPTLAGVSVWADQVREEAPEYRWTVPLHWVNFESGNCHYQAPVNCRDDLCVVAAIERFSQQLGDTWLPLAVRRDALKFVVHFVGDVHQPLHAGFAADRGGNDFQINIMREGWNLHSVWDSLIIDSLKLEWPAYRARLDTIPMTPGTEALLGIDRPPAWAEESCRIVQNGDFYPPRHKITGKYLKAKRPQVDQRLKLAGERLSVLLNQVLGNAQL
jgi:hypothetical protein